MNHEKHYDADTEAREREGVARMIAAVAVAIVVASLVTGAVRSVLGAMGWL